MWHCQDRPWQSSDVGHVTSPHVSQTCRLQLPLTFRPSGSLVLLVPRLCPHTSLSSFLLAYLHFSTYLVTPASIHLMESINFLSLSLIPKDSEAGYSTKTLISGVRRNYWHLFASPSSSHLLTSWSFRIFSRKIITWVDSFWRLKSCHHSCQFWCPQQWPIHHHSSLISSNPWPSFLFIFSLPFEQPCWLVICITDNYIHLWGFNSPLYNHWLSGFFTPSISLSLEPQRSLLLLLILPLSPSPLAFLSYQAWATEFATWSISLQVYIFLKHQLWSHQFRKITHNLSSLLPHGKRWRKHTSSLFFRCLPHLLKWKKIIFLLQLLAQPPPTQVASSPWGILS